MARYLRTNFNVRDLEKSIAFYEKALGLKETRRVHGPDGAFTIVFMGDGATDALLELTWLRDHPQPYDLGEGEFHIAYRVEDKKKAHSLHEEMGCICFENRDMDLYFIEDPDGYWIEILDR